MRPTVVSTTSRTTRNTESKTFTVPLFLSTSRSRMEQSRNQLYQNNDLRSVSSTRSLIDANGRPISPIQPLRPAVYQPPMSQPRSRQPREQSDLYGAGNAPLHPTRMPSTSDLESGLSSRSNSHSKSPRKPHHTRPRRKITRSQLLKSHIRSKLRLTISFGITLLIASIIYLTLALTHVSSSTIFHVLSIILLLSLTAIFSHSLIRYLMLKRDYRVHSERRIQRTQPPTLRGWDISWPRPLDNQPPPQPIPVYMHGDHETLSQLSEPHPREEEVDPVMQFPPPLYGNFRDSVVSNDLCYPSQLRFIYAVLLAYIADFVQLHRLSLSINRCRIMLTKVLAN